MSNIAIVGGRILDPGCGIDKIGTLLIRDGVVEGIVDSDAELGNYNVLRVDGMIVCSGFIDLHCHLREPGYEAKETIATGTRAAARGGFTTICCMPNTNPAIDSAEAVADIAKRAVRDGVVRVLAIGAITKGREGRQVADFESMAKAGAAGFSDDGSPVSDSGVMREALEKARTLGIPVIDHCEDLGMVRGGSLNEGRVARELGVGGMPGEAEETMVARDILLAKMADSWVHIAHVSTAVSVQMVRESRAMGIHVTCEATPHHLTLTEDIALKTGTAAKVNPPLRTQADVDAVVAGLNDGTIDVIATDHAPHKDAEKALDMAHAPSGISGFETALGSLMGLVKSGRVELKTIISKLTSEPARILGGRFGRIGSLSTGSIADVTIFDPRCEWTVDPTKFASKGHNTPLAGMVLKGKVMATVVEGRLVYSYTTFSCEHKEGIVRAG